MANEIMSIEKRAASYASELEAWISKDVASPEKSLKIPEGYNLGNEVMSAMLFIANNVKDKDGRSAMEVCTKDSILMGVRDMAINGLSITRNQVYPIVYGNKLVMMTSYFGQMACLNNIFPQYKITANVLYEGDEYDYCHDEFGDFNYIANVRSKLENRDKPIVAAYGSIFDKSTGKRVYGQVMTMKEIKTCWSHAKTSKVQNEFPQEMAQRTLINRLCKRFLKSASYRDVHNAELYSSIDRMMTAEYDFDDAEIIEADIPTQKAIRSKSKGQEGLASLLDRRDEAIPTAQKTAVNASIEEEREIIPDSPENASEAQEMALENELELDAGFTSQEMDELPF